MYEYIGGSIQRNKKLEMAISAILIYECIGLCLQFYSIPVVALIIFSLYF